MYFTPINLGLPDSGNFLVQIIKWLMQSVGSIILGVVLFTVLLKLITLPFDFWSRSSMRKNSLRMEEMRPELEKLQKQYANDKALYNQKMTALYKKNGYSMFGSCLPSIITLVIFIVAINAFNDFSKYQNSMYFYDMAKSYDAVCYEGFEYDDDNFKLVVNGKNGKYEVVFPDSVLDKNDGDSFSIYNVEVNGNKIIYSNTDSYIKLEIDKENNNAVSFIVDDDIKNKNLFKEKFGEDVDFEDKSNLDVLQDLGATAAAKSFRNAEKGFLWIKNIWITDSPLSHPINNDARQLNTASCSCSKAPEYISNNDYKTLIKKLDKELTEPNGYFIICVLTAGMSLLMQFVMNRSQKAQMELQTVDGQGAAQSKIMMVMMPIMMAIFSFIYTAAFSIYIIVSNILSILNTLTINKIVDKSFNKKKEKEVIGGKEVVRGRVYVAPEKPKEDKKKKKKKAPEPEYGDFITGKKHIK